MKRVRITILVAVTLVAAYAANGQWSKQHSGTLAWLHDVHFQTKDTGWIVGSDGVMLTTEDGGTTWRILPKFNSDNLLQIVFTDELNGWILCERNEFARGQNAISYVRKTADGGRTWSVLEFKDGGRERISKLLFSGSGEGSAFGESGIFYRLANDGTTWQKVPSSNHYLLLGGAFSDDKNGAIVGAGNTILFSDDEGRSWNRSSVLGELSSRIRSVFFVTPKLGWAVGSGGSILSTTAGGKLWRKQTSETRDDLNDVFFENERAGWAVGNNGTMLRTLNGGITWKQTNSRTDKNLDRIYFKNGRGWAVGFGGTILVFDEKTANAIIGKPQLIQVR